MNRWSGYYASNIRQSKKRVPVGPPEWIFDVYDKGGLKVLTGCSTATWSENGQLYDDIRESMIRWLKSNLLLSDRVYVDTAG